MGMPKKSWSLLKRISKLSVRSKHSKNNKLSKRTKNSKFATLRANRKKLLFLLMSLQYTMAYAEYTLPNSDNVITTIGNVNKTELDPKSIKLLIWNLYKGQRESFENNFIELAKAKDILVLQEMYLDQKMTTLFSGLSSFYFVGATSFLDDGIRTGVLTAALGRAKESKYLGSHFTEPIINTPKMSLLNYYAIRGFKSQLLVVNIHAINFVTVSAFEHQINDLYFKVKDYSGPIIFAGDFNTWSLGRMEVLKSYIGKLKLKEVHFDKDERLKFMGYPLDHVFYSSGMQLLKASVRGEFVGSDHKPLEVEFFLEQP
jgi:endonuclease/exonuclease/phosphatase (EEP) superfamily protein YafD